MLARKYVSFLVRPFKLFTLSYVSGKTFSCFPYFAFLKPPHLRFDQSLIFCISTCQRILREPFSIEYNLITTIAGFRFDQSLIFCISTCQRILWAPFPIEYNLITTTAGVDEDAFAASVQSTNFQRTQV